MSDVMLAGMHKLCGSLRVVRLGGCVCLTSGALAIFLKVTPFTQPSPSPPRMKKITHPHPKKDAAMQQPHASFPWMIRPVPPMILGCWPPHYFDIGMRFATPPLTSVGMLRRQHAGRNLLELDLSGCDVDDHVVKEIVENCSNLSILGVGPSSPSTFHCEPEHN